MPNATPSASSRSDAAQASAWLARALLIALAALASAGCASTPLAAWERGRFTRIEMRAAPDRLDLAMRKQIHASKEGTGIDLDPAGGGCGCN